MTYVYPSAQRLLAELNGVWTDITSYWIEDLTGNWGIQGNGPLDLLADTGVLRVVLNNMDQRFDPDSASALAGWKKGIRMKLEIVYDGETYVHAGTIGDISVPLSDDMVDKAFVEIADWMRYATKQPIVNPGILTNQRGDDVIRTVLSLMPIQPAASALDVGVSIFPTTFDTVTSETKAYSEFSKVAFSEPGYVYLRKDKAYGETLVFESAHSRHGLRTPDQLALSATDSGYLLKEDGGHLLKEDGGKILLNQAEQPLFDNNMVDVESDYGKQVINYFTVEANPRRKDTSTQVLFKLDTPILIGSGQTVTIKGNYADPTGGLPINANPADMITPTTPTDYKAWTNQDGTGTDFSASLVLVSTPFGTEGFTHQVRNDSIYAGWITKYNVRGLGIYNYNPIEHVEQDADSIADLGYYTETLNQKYQTALDSGRLYAAQVVDAEKKPRTDLEKITFLANESGMLMMAALNFGPGNLIRVIHTRRNVDNFFYIQGVSEFKLTPGGLIMCTWLIKKILCLLSGLSSLAVEFAGASTTDMVNFQYLPHVSNLALRTMSAWVYLLADTPVRVGYNNGHIAGPFSDVAGTGFGVTNGRKIMYYQKGTLGPGIWETPAASIPLNAWTHIVVTRDSSSPANAPTIYINGVVQTLTNTNAQNGPIADETGTAFSIGNIKTATRDYDRGINAKIEDVRVYNRIISAAEVTTLYNSGTPDSSLVTDGLVFQAFAVRTKELSTYVDQTLTDAMKVLDNIFGVVGTPHGAPIGRSF